MTDSRCAYRFQFGFLVLVLCISTNTALLIVEKDTPVEFRLSGSTEPNEGRLEVQFSNSSGWYGICKNSIDPLHASILCQDLGFWSACERRPISDVMTIEPPTQGQGVTPNDILTLVGSCRPDGSADDGPLWNCDDVTFSNMTDLCKAGEEIWLVCLAEPSQLDVRLSGGDREGEGYVEMRCPGSGHKWSAVCSQDWDKRDADTVCRQLGFPWSYSLTPQSAPGASLGELYYGNILCVGDEDQLGECSFIGEVDCVNSGVAGVKCGVGLNRPSENSTVALCGGHHCSHPQSTAMISDPRHHCRCDCQCVTFNDCCYDYPNQDLMCNNDNNTAVPDVAEYECVALPGSDISHTAFVLINTCPDGITVEADDRAMCEEDRRFNDVIGLLPVYDSSSGLAYKNIFCAICHGRSVSNISQWGIKLNYYPGNNGGGYINPSLLINIIGDVIGFEISPSGAAAAQVRRCPYDVVETCSSSVADDDNNMEAVNCSAYYAPITLNNTLYRNPHCAMCNGVKIASTQYCVDCPDECPQDPFLPCNVSTSCPSRIDSFETIDVTFSLDAFFDGVYGRSEAVTCPTGKIYDPFLRQCSSIPCTPLYNSTTGRMCGQQRTTTIQSISTTATDPTSTMTSTSHPSLVCFLRFVRIGLRLTGLVDIIINQQELQTNNIGDTSNCSDDVMSLDFIFKDYDHAFHLVDAIDTNLAAVDGIGNYTCPVCNVQTIKIFLKRQLKSKSVLSNICKSFIQPADADDSSSLALAAYDITNSIITRAPDFCVEENQQSCVTTKLNSSEYRIIDDGNRSIWLLEFDLSLCKEDYILRSGGEVEVCASLLFNPWSFHSVFETAVFACSGISIIALVVTFLVYCARAELRDINGKCQLNMMAALIVGLLLSRFSDFFLFHTVGCTAVAVVGHFIWLGAFCWIVLFASVVAIGADDGRQGLFCKLFFCGWIAPAIAVGLCLWLHFCQCRNVELSYGRDSHCWLQGGEALLFSLAVPITVLLLGSIVAFICGVLRLRKVRQFVTAYSGEITEYTVVDALIYVGMCLLLLLPWVFLIAHVLLNVEILYSFHQITHALQGLFVCIALLTIGKVRALCRQKPKPSTSDDAPSGVKRQLSKRVDAPDGASNRVWLKRKGSLLETTPPPGDNTWL